MTRLHLTNPEKNRQQVKIQLEREKLQRRKDKAFAVPQLKKALGTDFIPILRAEQKSLWRCPERVREIIEDWLHCLNNIRHYSTH